MVIGQSLKKIAEMLGRNKSTISREVLRNSGSRGYRPRQADLLCQDYAHSRCNALLIGQRSRVQVVENHSHQWIHEQIAPSLIVSRENIYHHTYADKVQGGSLWKPLRCQTKRRKRYTGEQDYRRQTVGRRFFYSVLNRLKNAVKSVTGRILRLSAQLTRRQ